MAATAQVCFELRCAGIEPIADVIAEIIAKQLLPEIRAIAAQQIAVLDAIESAVPA